MLRFDDRVKESAEILLGFDAGFMHGDVQAKHRSCGSACLNSLLGIGWMLGIPGVEDVFVPPTNSSPVPMLLP